MSYFKRVINSLSQMANAISGGNPDIPISARAYYYSRQGLYWFILLKDFIDFTFYPTGGEDHCKIAYLSDPDEKKMDQGNIYSNVAVSLLAVLGCIIIAPFTWLYFIIKKLINGIN